jgi:hypothetical protein
MIGRKKYNRGGGSTSREVPLFKVFICSEYKQEKLVSL